MVAVSLKKNPILLIHLNDVNWKKQKVTECGRLRSKVKTHLLQRCALIKFHVRGAQNTRDQITSDIEGLNARDHIALCAFHSFLVEVQTNAAYIYATHA